MWSGMAEWTFRISSHSLFLIRIFFAGHFGVLLNLFMDDTNLDQPKYLLFSI